jgi:hypothetical protein
VEYFPTAFLESSVPSKEGSNNPMNPFQPGILDAICKEPTTGDDEGPA